MKTFTTLALLGMALLGNSASQGASIVFDWNIVSSDVHPTFEYFPTAAAAPNVFTTGPFQNFQGGIGMASSITGLPAILAAVGGIPSNLTFEVGNFTLPLGGSPTPALSLDSGSFVNGDSTGTAIQTYLPGALPGFNNTLIVKNAGTPIAQGRITRVVSETVNLGLLPLPGFPGAFFLDLQTTGRAEFELDTALGPDTTIIDMLFELSGGALGGTLNLGVFGNDGSGSDPALFTSSGFLSVFTADFDTDGDIDGRDFLIWQRGFGGLATQATGDANEDNFANSTDLAIWERQFGAGISAPLAVAEVVPEPSCFLLATFAGLFGLGATHRRRA